MLLGPTFPWFRRYIPEEDLPVQEDTRGWNDQSVGQLDPLLPDALDLDRWRGTPSEDVLKPSRVPQRSTSVESPNGGTPECVGE